MLNGIVHYVYDSWQIAKKCVCKCMMWMYEAICGLRSPRWVQWIAASLNPLNPSYGSTYESMRR